MAIQQIQPEELFQRKLDGHPLYSAVVVATGKKMIFVAGTVSRNKKGEIVGAGDMRAQILQVARKPTHFAEGGRRVVQGSCQNDNLRHGH